MLHGCYTRLCFIHATDAALQLLHTTRPTTKTVAQPNEVLKGPLLGQGPQFADHCSRKQNKVFRFMFGGGVQSSKKAEMFSSPKSWKHLT